jgi:ribose transport system permease protein
MAAEGRSCVVISSELLEIIGLCHRVLVMRSGRIVADITGNAINKDEIMLYVPRLGSASAQTGLGWELEAITAVVVGGTALRGGSGRIWGSIAGALILTLIGNLLNLTSIISVYLNGAVQGVIILGAALLQRGSRSR